MPPCMNSFSPRDNPFILHKKKKTLIIVLITETQEATHMLVKENKFHLLPNTQTITTSSKVKIAYKTEQHATAVTIKSCSSYNCCQGQNRFIHPNKSISFHEYENVAAIGSNIMKRVHGRYRHHHKKKRVKTEHIIINLDANESIPPQHCCECLLFYAIFCIVGCLYIFLKRNQFRLVTLDQF